MAYRRSLLMEQRLSENTERILAATRTLIAKGGYREAQISAIARTAGLSTGTIYRYFPSKADLFVKVLGEAVKSEIKLLQTIVRSKDSAPARLEAAVESFVRRALAGPQLAYAFIAEPVDPKVDRARIRYRRMFGDVFETVLREGIATGEFPAQSVEISAACVVGAFTEALVGPVAPKTRGTGDKERLVRAICDFCIHAVCSSPCRQSAPPATRKA